MSDSTSTLEPWPAEIKFRVLSTFLWYLKHLPKMPSEVRSTVHLSQSMLLGHRTKRGLVDRLLAILFSGLEI